MAAHAGENGNERKQSSETELILGRPVDAAAKDPVQVVAAGKKIEPRWRKRYEQLLQLRDHVIDEEVQLENRARENPPNFAMHSPADTGTQQFLDDLSRGRASGYQEMLDEINDALSRIESGTYGTCELTGEPIAPERLDAVPWTRFSKQAEERLEAEGNAPVRFELPPQFTTGDASSGRTEVESTRHREPDSDRT